MLAIVGLVGCGEPRRDFLMGGGGGQPSSTLFLNYEGGTFVNVGVEDAVKSYSTIVQGQTRFAGYHVGDVDRASKLDALTDEVTDILAPYSILVTAKRPTKGPYHVILFTDSDGRGLGCPTCFSGVPALCDRTVASATGFVFGGAIPGGEIPLHMATSQAISLVGSFGAIPTSSQVGDCMCYAEAPCIQAQQTMTSACTIGGPDTPLSTMQACPTSVTTMDEHAEFLVVYGSSM